MSSSMQGGEPEVSVSSLDEERVVLLRTSDPGFYAGWTGAHQREWDKILPYTVTVVIQNNSDREVIAYAVAWHCIGNDGTVKTPI